MMPPGLLMAKSLRVKHLPAVVPLQPWIDHVAAAAEPLPPHHRWTSGSLEMQTIASTVLVVTVRAYWALFGFAPPFRWPLRTVPDAGGGMGGRGRGRALFRFLLLFLPQ